MGFPSPAQRAGWRGTSWLSWSPRPLTTRWERPWAKRTTSPCWTTTITEQRRAQRWRTGRRRCRECRSRRTRAHPRRHGVGASCAGPLLPLSTDTHDVSMATPCTVRL